jgi:alpha 1,6-mannosyltransferase
MRGSGLRRLVGPKDILVMFMRYDKSPLPHHPVTSEPFESFFPAYILLGCMFGVQCLLKVITDEVADILISHLYGTVPTVIEAWFALPLPILKADFFRYLILLARGGIYADIDTEALRPAHQWLPKTSPANTVGLIIGIEADPTREDWSLWYSRRIQFCQWTMRAKIGHPVLVETVVRIVAMTLAKKDNGSLTSENDLGNLSIIEWTGPAVWTDSIFYWMNAQTKTGKGTKPGAGSEEWSWVQFTGITEPKVPILHFIHVL